MKKKLALIGGALAVCIAAYLLWTCQPWRTEPEAIIWFSLIRKASESPRR